MTANDYMIGGSHYKNNAGLDHWDFVIANDLNYLEGQITKYVARCRKKNGKQDLEKAMHFLTKYLEVWDEMNLAQDKGRPNDLHQIHEDTEFQCEGYYGDLTQLYRCRGCRALIRSPGLEEARQTHGSCPNGAYTNQG